MHIVSIATITQAAREAVAMRKPADFACPFPPDSPAGELFFKTYEKQTAHDQKRLTHELVHVGILVAAD